MRRSCPEEIRERSRKSSLNAEMLRGNRTALGIAGFIGIYWKARIKIDAFYFAHSDRPRGRYFVVEHILLTALLVLLAITYLALVVWHASHWRSMAMPRILP
jgi:hypothetical protein